MEALPWRRAARLGWIALGAVVFATAVLTRGPPQCEGRLRFTPKEQIGAFAEYAVIAVPAGTGARSIESTTRFADPIGPFEIVTGEGNLYPYIHDRATCIDDKLETAPWWPDHPYRHQAVRYDRHAALQLDRLSLHSRTGATPAFALVYQPDDRPKGTAHVLLFTRAPRTISDRFHTRPGMFGLVLLGLGLTALLLGLPSAVRARAARYQDSEDADGWLHGMADGERVLPDDGSPAFELPEEARGTRGFVLFEPGPSASHGPFRQVRRATAVRDGLRRHHAAERAGTHAIRSSMMFIIATALALSSAAVWLVGRLT